MLLTRKTDYALVALAGLAQQGTRSCSARDLGDQLHLPLPVLRNILKLLTAGGMLISTRGPSGGYRLARSPSEITLTQVFEVIEGPVQLALCCPVGADEDEPKCHLEPSCQIKGSIRRVHESLLRFLDQVTLAQIACDETPGEPTATAADRVSHLEKVEVVTP